MKENYITRMLEKQSAGIFIYLLCRLIHVGSKLDERRALAVFGSHTLVHRTGGGVDDCILTDPHPLLPFPSWVECSFPIIKAHNKEQCAEDIASL